MRESALQTMTPDEASLSGNPVSPRASAAKAIRCARSLALSLLVVVGVNACSGDTTVLSEDAVGSVDDSVAQEADNGGQAINHNDPGTQLPPDDGEASGSPPPTVATSRLDPKDVDAARFLMQASFGPSPESLVEFHEYGSRSAWIDWQMQLPVSLTEPYTRANSNGSHRSARHEGWWNNVLYGEDQLRQRVAFALSQIFVVSDIDYALGNQQYGMANYYDMLSKNAFGNYRELLEDVALHPVMGVYLSMVRNERADLSDDNPRVTTIDLAPLTAIAGEPDALLDWFNLYLFAGNMPDSQRALLADYLDELGSDDAGRFARAEDALFLILASPQQQLQR